ncbi:MAG: ATP-binding protein [Chloroflexi bacterium]|nr:ATP-binding protein [Anaerolineaceae bacterium]NMB89211.1 ATP-binding protein [Chloroflexota bacterium]
MTSSIQSLAAQNGSSDVIGYVVGGSLKDNLQVRLTVPSQQVQEGGFVVIESGAWMFYGLITDIQLGATDPRFADEQSEARLPAGLAQLLHGQTLYTNLAVMPALMLESGPEPGDPAYGAWRAAHPEDQTNPLPVKTVPSHHAGVRLAAAGDVAMIFGEPNGKERFVIGTTREQDLPVCIDLKKLVQRSSGIFGATGTGKSFLTRIILAGMIQYNASSVLMFDMHNEYGFDDTASDTNQRVIGLRTGFPGKVRVVGLGRSTSIRGQMPDFHLEIGESDIQPEDIELLTRELNLKETTSTTLDALVHTFGRASWFHEFKSLRPNATVTTEEGKQVPAPDSVEAWAFQAGVHPGAAAGLHSKLTRVFNRPYIAEKPAADSLQEIIRTLEAGQHVVLSFGEFESDLDYLLVTNLLTRRIRSAWEERTNHYRSHGGQEPRPLVVAVEEAHKLLNREMAAQTTFSTIARELRKYYVTLLIIDQRPSQIYDEVMSQLGTRISGWLGDDADVQAVLSGLAGREALRGMLARLQPKEEVLLLGWGVPMPIPVHSRRYDERFWEDLKGALPGKRKADQILGELGF